MDFEYFCVDAAGRESRGSLSALDPDEARGRLKGMGLLVVEVREKKEKAKRFYNGGKKIKAEDLYNFSKELSVLFNSGINLDKALELLLASVAAGEMKAMLQQLLRDIKAGKSLSQAFEETGRFTPFVKVMVKVGESTGDLRAAFENISQYMNFQIRFKNELRNTMTYPIFLVLSSVVILIAMFKFIIPRFFSIFGQEVSSLPLTSRALYHISNLVNSGSVFIVLGLLAVLLLFSRRINYMRLFKKAYDYMLYLPVMRNLVLNLELSRFSYSMYSMLRSGVEFIQALKLSKDVIQNSAVRAEIERTVPQIKEGKGIADVFAYVSFIPPMMSGMLRVGENSGTMKEIFFELHSIFDEKFRNSMKRLVTLLEPAVILVMGVIVGAIVISLILTVMNVSNIKL